MTVKAPEQEPLLGTSERGPLASSSSLTAAEEGASQEDTKDPNSGKNVSAQNVVKWAIWLLLGAVLVGTVLGTVLVSIPLQRSAHAPGPRKSAAVVVIGQTGAADDSGFLDVRQPWDAQTEAGRQERPRLVVWSGKEHQQNTVYNDLYTFDITAKRWRALYRLSRDDGIKQHYPAPRWKAVTLKDAKRNSLLVYGGDPLGSDGLGKGYLSDIWRLNLSEHYTELEWQRLAIAEGDSPEPRRASAGIIMELNGTSYLVIWSGRDRHKRMLPDVWMASLDRDEIQWLRIPDSLTAMDVQDFLLDADQGPHDSEAEDVVDLGKRHKKRKHRHQHAPAPRKGHVAVYAEYLGRHYMIIWGGRDADQYYDDLWAFDLETFMWEEWMPQTPAVPNGRNHLGGFHANGVVYIYGGVGAKASATEDLSPTGDMWAFNISSRTWEEVIADGRTPPSRYLYSTDTYTVQSLESQDTRFVVFGGASKHKCYLDDLWVYSVSENMWSEKSKLSPGQPHRCRYLNN